MSAKNSLPEHKAMLTILQGDWIEQLKTLPDQSVQCCVTSPPYWGLRDYGVKGQLGLEKTPQEYVEKIVAGFREVRRVLKDDGTLWLNLGDSYNASGKARGGGGSGPSSSKQKTNGGAYFQNGSPIKVNCCKPKDLIGIPWMVAFALRGDGWYLRSDIIWAKPNPMPESVTDRPTKSHEYIFLLSKKAKYFYDTEAIAEPASDALYEQVEQGYDGDGIKDYASAGVQNPSSVKARIIANARKRADRFGGNKHNGDTSQHSDGSIYTGKLTRNKRSVWTVNTAPYRSAHFATFPPDLIKPCILAGSRAGDTILDPFFGSGTTGMVSLELGRKCIGIELNKDYIKLAERRCDVTYGLKL